MHGLSTYARLFLGFSEGISRQIIDSSRKNPNKQTPILPITILSANQIDQALSDPHNQFLKEAIKTHADDIHADRIMIKAESDLQKEQIFVEEARITLASRLKSTDPTIKASTTKAMESLKEKSKALANIQNAINYNEKQSAAVSTELDSLTEKYHDEWGDYLTEHLENLKTNLDQVLEKAHLPALPQGEVDNLLHQDNWCESKDRFTDLGGNQDLPAEALEKLLGLETTTPISYLKLKAYMAIRSVCLSRENIPQLLKQLNSVFTQAEQAGKALNEKQTTQIKSLDQNQVEPIIATMKRNTSTLESVKAERDTILKTVASWQDIQSIQEKAEARISGQAPTRKYTS